MEQIAPEINLNHVQTKHAYGFANSTLFLIHVLYRTCNVHLLTRRLMPSFHHYAFLFSITGSRSLP